MNIDFSRNEILINHLKQGNENAYAFLMDTYYVKLCVYAKSLCLDLYQSEDIVQNIFMRIWERRQQLNDNYSIRNYLYQCVYNEFINQYRKNDKLLTLEKEYISALNSILEEEDPTEIASLVAIVKKEIQMLPPQLKKIILLAKEEGLTYGEIAEHLGVSYKSVENHMSKAFSMIREKIGKKSSSIYFDVTVQESKPKKKKIRANHGRERTSQ